MEENRNEQFEKNFEHLVKQLKFTGMPETLQFELREKMLKGDTDFSINFKTGMGRHPAEVALNFRKSDKGNYFFNSYDLEVKPEHGEALTQRFYVRGPETGKAIDAQGQVVDKTINSTITLKEAVNLLTPQDERQRSVLKNYVTKQGDVYSAYVSLDMTQKENGNYPLVKRPDFPLEEKLQSLPVRIKEMETPESRRQFVESLQKGNRQIGTIITPGNNEYKRSFEVNATHKTVNIYDGDIKLSPSKAIPVEKEQVAEKQSQEQSKNNRQKQFVKRENDGEDASGDEGTTAKKRKSTKKLAA
ncbi:hypothetical protein [Taibaiella koreensis]|uniref:hypothetical protein n=1 Tax=Taibaiella koreensis TaxID=1268548 RepID=UPI000E59A886|nr:hypothetical protein [Taibaiella koreensis]